MLNLNVQLKLCLTVAIVNDAKEFIFLNLGQTVANKIQHGSH